MDKYCQILLDIFRHCQILTDLNSLSLLDISDEVLGDFYITVSDIVKYCDMI